MSNIQIVTVIVVALLGLGVEFVVTRKATNSIVNSSFAYNYAGGGIAGWVAILSMLPGVVVLWLLHLLFDWDYPVWVAWVLAVAALITMFVAIYGPGVKRPAT